jgi:serine/tyrosine/threonine adenylyltransferase
LGEVRNERGEKWDLHLKGAGQTPFSRHGDGRAVLRSSIREYLGGEAMHGLGIPTTRALCLVGSEDEVLREEGVESGAMLIRMAPSHVRFGSFEVFAHRRQTGSLTQLADYVIDNHFPHLQGASDRYFSFFREVVLRTAELVAKWQAAGFAHGVLNTDNMSILGLTLDYGPFGFLDDYDAGLICNHSDRGGRYAFHRQPNIANWNLHALGEALLSLISEDEAKEALACYEPMLVAHYTQLVRAKLGLAEWREEDGALLSGILEILQENHIDYTTFFRRLGALSSAEADSNSGLGELFTDRSAFDAWVEKYRRRLRSEGSEDPVRRALMDRVNPRFVLRNHLAHTAITMATEKRDYSEIEKLRRLLRNPYQDEPGMEHYAAAPPDWSKNLVVGCSS